jgi:hypothetical protein
MNNRSNQCIQLKAKSNLGDVTGNNSGSFQVGFVANKKLVDSFVSMILDLSQPVLDMLE